MPHIDYMDIIYSGSSIANQKSIERIQRYFTKRLHMRLYPLQTVPDYAKRLKTFGLTTIETRRNEHDLICLYKIANKQMLATNINIKFSLQKSNRIILSRVRSNSARLFFQHRASVLWNKLISTHPPFSSISELRTFLSNLPASNAR